MQNLSQISLESGGVFSDGYSLETARLQGSVQSGYSLDLAVGV